MHNRRAIFAAILLFCLSIPSAAFAADVQILFTHDLHSSVQPYKVLTPQNTVETVGGYAQLKSAIGKTRNGTSVLVDAGDFSVGSLYNLVLQDMSPDLTLMGDMGYDATTFGNHEFDYYPDGLARILKASKGRGPRILAANLVYGNDPASRQLRQEMKDYGSTPTAIITRNGVKIGVFGVIGQRAVSFSATMDKTTCSDITKASRTAVARLKAQGADVIIALSHNGTTANHKNSPDEELAKAVPGIDVIVSGHSHTVLSTPIKVGDTLIVSCGSRGRYLGDLTVSENSGTVKLKSYRLVPVSGQGSAAMTAAIKPFQAGVSAASRKALGFSGGKVIAYAPKNLDNADDIQTKFGAYGLANLISDSYLNETKGLVAPGAISVVGAGMIRDSLYKGNVTVSDAYDVLSLGIGPDKSLGYPLTSVYLTGTELRQFCDVDVSMFTIMPEAQLFFSGLRYTYNDNRLLMNRVIDLQAQNADGTWSKVEPDRLYNVVGSLYLIKMAGMVNDTSKGIIHLSPRDKNGAIIKNLDTAVLHDKNGAEIKEWKAFVDYLDKVSAGGTKPIPAKYYTARKQRTLVKTNLVTLFEKPSAFAWIAAGGLIVLVLVVAAVVYGIARLIKAKTTRR